MSEYPPNLRAYSQHRKALRMASQGVMPPVFDSYAKHMKLISEGSALATIGAKHHHLENIIVNKSYLDGVAGPHQRYFESIGARAYAPWMRISQQRAGDLFSTQSWPLARIGQQEKLAESLTRQFAPLTRIRQQEELVKSIRRSIGAFGTDRQLRALVDSITGRSRFASMVGIDASVASMTTMPQFKAMVGTSVMPRDQWAGMFERIRLPLGEELYEDSVLTFDASADLVESRTDHEWWVLRLPFHVQLGLMILALQGVDATGDFVCNITHNEIPPEVRSAAKLLFALATILVGYLAAQAEAEDDSE